MAVLLVQHRTKRQRDTKRLNFQCLGVLLIWIIVGQGPTCACSRCGSGLFGHFFLSSIFSIFFLPLRYRLKYCLKGPLNPKQPTNQLTPDFLYSLVPPTMVVQQRRTCEISQTYRPFMPAHSYILSLSYRQLRVAGRNCLKIRKIQLQWQLSKVNFNQI